MADPDKALATQLANIEKRTGKALSELAAIVKGSGLTRTASTPVPRPPCGRSTTR